MDISGFDIVLNLKVVGLYQSSGDSIARIRRSSSNQVAYCTIGDRDPSPAIWRGSSVGAFKARLLMTRRRLEIIGRPSAAPCTAWPVRKTWAQLDPVCWSPGRPFAIARASRAMPEDLSTDAKVRWPYAPFSVSGNERAIRGIHQRHCIIYGTLHCPQKTRVIYARTLQGRQTNHVNECLRGPAENISMQRLSSDANCTLRISEPKTIYDAAHASCTTSTAKQSQPLSRRPEICSRTNSSTAGPKNIDLLHLPALKSLVTVCAQRGSLFSPLHKKTVNCPVINVYGLQN